MTKAEILKDKNVSQIIKDIIAKAPEDAEIEVKAIKLGRAPEADKEGCSCEGCDGCKEVSYPDGLDVSAYLSSIGDMACNLVDMTDNRGRLDKEDVARALGYVDCISGIVSQLYNFLSSYGNEGK